MTLWESYPRMKFDAVTLAAEDLPDMDAIPAATRPLVTLANVVKPDGKLVFAPTIYREVKTKDGRKVRVAIIGLVGRSLLDRTSPSTPPSTSASTSASTPVKPEQPWKVKDATETLRAVLPEARKKADLVVVLYSALRDQARRLAGDVPGVDIMVAGLEGSVDQKVEMVGKTALVQNSDRGRFAGSLGITLDEKKLPTGFTISSTAMSAEVPNDPEMFKLVQQYQLKQAMPVTAPTTTTPGHGTTATTQPTVNTVTAQPLINTAVAYAGSYACSGCHDAEVKQWKSTKHAIAMQTLELKDGGLPARRPDCVKCHVVGFDKAGGFEMARPRWDLRDVGCESCHGPAAAHVQAKRQGTPDKSGIVKFPTKEVCVTCHTTDNSPNFDYAKYLPHVQHAFKGTLPKLPAHGMPDTKAMSGGHN